MEANCETGFVTEINPQFVEIAVDTTQEECHRCPLSNWCSMAGQTSIKIPREEIPQSLQINQKVEIRFEKIIQTSFLLYLFPMLFFMGAILVAKYLFFVANELFLFGIGIGALMLSLGIIKWFNNRLSARPEYKIKIVPL